MKMGMGMSNEKMFSMMKNHGMDNNHEVESMFNRKMEHRPELHTGRPRIRAMQPMHLNPLSTRKP